VAIHSQIRTSLPLPLQTTLVELRTYLYDKTPANMFDASTPDTNPGIPDTNRHVKLSMSNFGSFTSVSPVGAQGPDLAENPFIGRDRVLVAHELAHGIVPPADVTLGTRSVEGNFLLDSGMRLRFFRYPKRRSWAKRWGTPRRWMTPTSAAGQAKSAVPTRTIVAPSSMATW